MTAADLLHYAAHKKIGYLQFGDNLPLHQLPEADRNLLLEMATARGVQVEVGTRRLTKEHILHYLAIAKSFGSRFLRVVIDDVGYHPTEGDIQREINNLLPYLQEAGVILAIENHDRFPAKILERIIRKTDERWVGICLDTANSLGAGEGFSEVLSVLAPYTVNLHVKDITINRLSHKMGFRVEGCAAGKGLLDIPAMVSVLRPYDRCQTATVEVWSVPEQTIGETLEKEKAWVEESINYLKTILA